MVLLQQPEVHLHPRAQAALGSLFPKLVTGEGKQFIIETHSDYLIDRIRQEVAKGSIESGNVLILFFDKPRQYTKVHRLLLDKQGNIQGAPRSYRKFFLTEEHNLLSRGES
jgi:predicted ATPase